jgi:hypothetical protein
MQNTIAHLEFAMPAEKQNNEAPGTYAFWERARLIAATELFESLIRGEQDEHIRKLRALMLDAEGRMRGMV